MELLSNNEKCKYWTGLTQISSKRMYFVSTVVVFLSVCLRGQRQSLRISQTSIGEKICVSNTYTEIILHRL